MSEYAVDLGFDNRRMIQDSDGYCFSADSVVLANCIKAQGKTVVELGTGTGVIALLLALKKGAKKVIGIEIDPKAAALAVRNVKDNLLEGVIEIVNDDLRGIEKILGCGFADVVACNPPYFDVLENAGKLGGARFEKNATIEDFVATAKKLLRFGGEFYTVQKCARITDVLCAMRANAIEPKRLILISPKPSLPPDTFVVVGKLGAKPSLQTELMTLANEDGTMSAECARLYN